MSWFRPRHEESFRVESVTTFPREGVIVLWSVAYGPTLPRIGIWLKVGEFAWDGYSQFAYPKEAA